MHVTCQSPTAQHAQHSNYGKAERAQGASSASLALRMQEAALTIGQRNSEGLELPSETCMHAWIASYKLEWGRSDHSSAQPQQSNKAARGLELVFLKSLQQLLHLQKILPTKKLKSGQAITKFFDSSKDGVTKPQVPTGATFA